MEQDGKDKEKVEKGLEGAARVGAGGQWSSIVARGKTASSPGVRRHVCLWDKLKAIFSGGAFGRCRALVLRTTYLHVVGSYVQFILEWICPIDVVLN